MIKVNLHLFNINYKVYGGYDEETTFSLDGLPENTGVSFDPSQTLQINSNGSVEVTLSIDEDALAKSFIKCRSFRVNNCLCFLSMMLSFNSTEVLIVIYKSIDEDAL